MSCKVTIISPKTGERVESLEYNKILDYVKSDKDATEMYSKIQSDSFKSWFGDYINNPEESSKVVNEIGEPLLLFHFTHNEFSSFNPKKSSEEGFHFGTRSSALDRASARIKNSPELEKPETLLEQDRREELILDEKIGKLMPVFLNIRNLIEGADYLEAEPSINNINPKSQNIIDFKIDYSKREYKYLIAAFVNKDIITEEQGLRILKGESSLELETKADGYWYINQHEDKGSKTYVVFNPNNIKSLYNVGTFSNETDDVYKQSQVISSIASKDTLTKFKEWADRLGLKGSYLSQMVINGKKYNTNGIADIAKSTYYVLNGKEYTSEPEEITHFLVEALEESNPKLFNSMMSSIRDYRIYKEVYNEYSSDLNYQKDGKPDIKKIKKEAIAKLLVEQVIKKEEGKTEKPELLSKIYSFWQQIKDWFNSLISKAKFNPFEEAINQFDNLGPINSNNQEIFAQPNPNQVNATLKIIPLLQSDKAKISFKRVLNGQWDLKRYLTELQIPTNQQKLIPEGMQFQSPDEISAYILANYSYTIEINTAKNKIGSDIYGRGYEPKQITDKDFANSLGAEVGDYFVEYITEDGDPDLRTFKTLEEANQAFQTQRSADNSSVYSNLTVPGGTNGSYRELDIQTPMITPSIKSHAQFADSEHSIGWYRVDDKQNYQEKDIDNLIEIMKKSGILEVNCG